MTTPPTDSPPGPTSASSTAAVNGVASGHLPRRETAAIGRSWLIGTAGILASRVFGLVRDIVLAWYWGSTGVMQAAFNVAFAIPNMLRALFSEGAFAAAFVPMIAAKLGDGDRAGAWRLAERAISLQATVLAAITLLAAGCCGATYAFLPETASEHVRLTFLILPILMPYALFICLAGAFASILNALRQFALPALNPILFNVVQIATVLLLYPLWRMDELPALIVFCLSILLAGLLQMLSLMLICRRRGFIFHFQPAWNDPEVRQFCAKVLPAILGNSVQQCNNLIDKALVMYLGPAAIGALAYSQHLVYLPTGIFGVAMGVVCLTSLSQAWNRGSLEEMASSLDFALRQMLFLTIPCAILGAVLAEPIIRILFQRGAFNEEAVRECAWALRFYLPGLPAFCLAKVAITPHNARKDTATPVKVSMVCIGINLILNLILMQFLRQGGLALSTSLCSWLNVLALLWLCRGHLPQWQAAATARAAVPMLAAAVLSGLAAWLTANLTADRLADWPAFAAQSGILLAGAAAGGMAYLAACVLLRCPEPRQLASCRKRPKTPAA